MYELIKKRIFFILLMVGSIAYYLRPIKLEDSIVLWIFCHLILNCFIAHYHLNVYKNRDKEVFSVLLAMSLYNIINFTISICWVAPEEFQLSPVSSDALMYSFFAYAIFYIVYYLLYNNLYNNIKPFHHFKLNAKIVDLFIYVCSGLYFIGFYSDLGLPILINSSMFFAVGAMLYKLVEKNKVSFLQIVIFCYILYRETIGRATSGLIFLLIIFFLFCYLVIQFSTKSLRKNSISFILLVGGLLFYLIFSPIKIAYRNFAWKGDASIEQLSVEDRFNKIIELTEENSKKNNYENKERKTHDENPMWRFSYQASAISMVMEKTPEEVPYWNGVTYLPIFTKFIPRILWPDKPIENMGQQFGHAYHKLSDDDTFTSMNNPILAEMFMNFGIWGMMIGSIILGIIFILIAKIFNQKSKNPFDNILNLAFLLGLFSWESNASQLVGIYVIYYILFTILFRILNSVA